MFSQNVSSSGNMTVVPSGLDSRDASALSCKSKCAIVAFIVSGVAGAAIVVLGGLNLFGSVGSVGFIASIAGGSTLILIALGAFVICKFKPEVQKMRSEPGAAERADAIQPVNNQTETQAQRAKLYFVSDQAYTEHLTGKDHPEQPGRITSINHALEQAGLKDKNNSISPRLATREEIELCHDADYIKKVESEIGHLKPQELISLSTGDVVISQKSLHAARLAVGGVLTAVDQVFTSEASKAFCIVRPPGHHASCARGAGFCIFNNVAIAARYAQQKYHVKRVLIVDWDVHHGDGTQNIFYADPSVFYFSTHEEGNYPHTGKREETGREEGKGFTMNIPIPGKRLLDSRQGTGAKVIEAFRNQLTKAMNHFQPEFILISCGFDGHKDDPLGGFDLTNEDYATLTTCINQIANKYAHGRVVSVLEGGYNLEAIAAASVSHVRALRET
jgi:acetoin utilization deacetylase AcuC-like enzyme